ncbi:hypothetical protein NQZ79_g3839 [Umbelopsis isabellina]|nr:hypothetical protein NQZ79_g3839 [Umbelopsis isabellina]
MSDQENSTVKVEACTQQNENNVLSETEVTAPTSTAGVVVEDEQKTLPLRLPITYDELSDDEVEPWMDDEKLQKAEDVDTDDLISDIPPHQKTRGNKGANGRSSNRQRRKKTYYDDTDANSDDAFEGTKRKTAPKRKPAAKKPNGKGKAVEPMINIAELLKASKPRKPAEFDPARVSELSAKYPDTYWEFHADSEHYMVDCINESEPLEALPNNISDQAAITGMALSKDGAMLASLSNIGAIKIWDIENDFKLLRKLRDNDEEHIDEFYCGKFLSDSQGLIAAGGKLKDRHRWSAEDDDNHILPCPIKIFDVLTGKVVARLDGHSEEILCLKDVMFDGERYLISTSQDGYIFKWHLSEDWSTLLDAKKMDDGITCMAFTVSFVPNTGNKYFLAACDEHVRLYDFESCQMMQTFEDLYSSYCDCGKFIKWLDEDRYLEETKAEGSSEKDEKPYAWFITRGAEMCDMGDGISSTPNTCTLHKLVYPVTKGGKFELQEVKKYKHEDYHSNSWLVKIASNGRYLLAPTIYGQIFAFNMLSGQVTGILKDHEDLEVRDVMFHPYRPLIFSSGDDGYVKVYTYSETTLCSQLEKDLKVGNSINHSGDEVMDDVTDIKTESMIEVVTPVKRETPSGRVTRKSRTSGDGDDVDVDVEG